MTTVTQLITRSQELLGRARNAKAHCRELATIMNELAFDTLPLPGKMTRSGDGSWQRDGLYTTFHFSLDMFSISQGQVIPFHDHPSMWVLMRTLWGRLHVVAYDWILRHPRGGLARHTYDLALSGGDDTLIIDPDHGNIHQVVADEDCVFLDLTFPPFSEQQQRACRFYRIAGEQLVDGGRLTRLVPVALSEQGAFAHAYSPANASCDT